jgi:signal transduction histidine kinase/ActR/RegA family two-component response regulator
VGSSNVEGLQTPASPRRALALTVGGVLLFAAIFLPLEGIIGRGAGPFAVAPVVLAAWYFGIWGGVTVGLFMPVLGTLLLNLDGRAGLDILVRLGAGPGAAMLPVLGGFVGWLRNLNVRLGRQTQLLEAQRDQLQTQASELEALSRTKDEFVSLVSHELRTPLTSVKGYVDLLLDGEVGDISADQREFLGIVRNNADRLIVLINELLDLARIESGRTQIVHESVDLRALLYRVVESLRPQFDAKHQTLTLDVTSDAPSLLRVAGDPARLTQVFVNLLSNAHKYTPDGGVITLATRRVENRVQVDVIDTGIGLSSLDQERLFEKFFRSSNPAVQSAGGTGLGLAITRELVRLHGGEVSVSSQPHVGSTFTVTLPAEPGSQLAPSSNATSNVTSGHTTAAAAIRGSDPGASRAKRVLVVDDEPDIAGLIRRYLERGGYSVSVAGTAAEAVQLAQSDPPDLITLDIKLPDADGFTVIEWLRAHPQTATIPVIPISILPDTGRAQSMGIEDYLNKPVDEALLLSKVDRILTTPEEVFAAIERHLAPAPAG